MWSGFFQSTVDPRNMGTVELDVNVQRQRRFAGVVTMKSFMPFTFDFAGTIAANGALNGVGHGDAGMVEFHGLAGFLPGGGGFVDVHYMFRAADGTRDEGFAIVLRNFVPPEGCTPPDVTGVWSGSFTSASGATGDLTAIYAAARDADLHSFTGLTRLSMGDSTLAFTDMGTIDCEMDGVARVVVIGMGASGRAIFTGVRTIDPRTIQPCVKGTYVLEFFDGTTDMGSFEIMQQPVGVGE